MDVDTATAAKSDLRLLFLYRLVSPSTLKRGITIILPQQGRPTDKESASHFLNAKVEEIWLYGCETGESIAK